MALGSSGHGLLLLPVEGAPLGGLRQPPELGLQVLRLPLFSEASGRVQVVLALPPSVQAAITSSARIGWLISNRHLPLTVPEAGSQTPGCRQMQCLGRACLLAPDWLCSCCVLTGGGGSSLEALSRRSITLFMRKPVDSRTRPNYDLVTSRDPPPQNVTLGE